jgi:putative transcriptional regulator
VHQRVDRASAIVNDHLRALRAERGWSQQHLADLLGVSRQNINAIETGRFDPSLPLAFKLAELFGLAIENVFVSPSKG